MTDNLTVEGDGAGTPPKAPVSQPAIEGADSLSKLLDAKLTEALKPLLGEIRGVQGKADRLDKSQREFLDEYERQKKDGKSQAEAESAATKVISERSKAQMRDEALDLLLKREGLLSDQPVGNGAAGTVDVAKVIARTQVDPQSPDIVALTSRKWETEDALELALFRHKAGTPQPTQADTSAPPSAPVRSGSYEEKAVRMEQLVKNYSKNAPEIERLEKEMRDMQNK